MKKAKRKRPVKAFYEDRIVLFVDILGFKKLIESSIDSDGSEILERTKHIKTLLEIFRENFKAPQAIKRSKRITQFSDSIVVSWKTPERSQVFYTLLEVLHLHIEILNVGELVRGAVAVGKLHHSKDFIFGPALVRAYEFETTKAIFPRVIVEPAVLKLGSQHAIHGHTAKIENDHLEEITVRDTDGESYVNYFENALHELDYPNEMWPGYLEKIRSIVLKGLGDKDPGLKKKHLWLRDRFNSLVRKYNTPEVVERAREALDDEYAEYYRALKEIPE